jgi:hypothetical protein
MFIVVVVVGKLGSWRFEQDGCLPGFACVLE